MIPPIMSPLHYLISYLEPGYICQGHIDSNGRGGEEDLCFSPGIYGNNPNESQQHLWIIHNRLLPASPLYLLVC